MSIFGAASDAEGAVMLVAEPGLLPGECTGSEICCLADAAPTTSGLLGDQT